MSDCPFCRSSNLVNDAEKLAMMMTRVEKKDPDAINHLRNGYFYEMFGLQTNRRRAVELYTEAAELGSIDALHILGDGVQKDNGKAAEFYEKAALQGHAESRYNLGCMEKNKGNNDRALRHWLISVKMGEKIHLMRSRMRSWEGWQRKSSTRGH